MQGAGAVVDAYSMRTAAIGGKLLLKRGDFTAEGELASVQDALNGGVHLLLDAGVLRLEIEKGDQVTTPLSSQVNGLAAAAHRTRGRLDKLHDPETRSAIGQRRLAGFNAIEEMLRFHRQAPRCRRASAPTCRRCGSRPASRKSGAGRR